MVVDFTSGVLDPAVLPVGVDLLLQGNDSVVQPIGDHTDFGQSESFKLDELF
jgi:hypothetical protein